MAAIEVSEENFQQEVLEAQGKVLVDFWADWCGPCRMIGPILAQIGDEVEGLKVCKVNVDHAPSLAKNYGVMSIPTLVVFEQGQVVKKEVGAMPKSEILKMVQE